MMSGKRFQLDIGDDYCFINDELEDKTYAIYNSIFKERWSQEIVDLLNNLAEENEVLLGNLFESYEYFRKSEKEYHERVMNYQTEIKRLEKMIWKIQWRFQQEVGIEKAKEHYREIDKEMEE